MEQKRLGTNSLDTIINGIQKDVVYIEIHQPK